MDGDLNQYKIVPLFGAAYAAPNKGTILYRFRSPSTVLNPTVNSIPEVESQCVN